MYIHQDFYNNTFEKKIEMLYLFTRSACSTTYKDLRLAKCHKPDSSAYIKKKKERP